MIIMICQGMELAAGISNLSAGRSDDIWLAAATSVKAMENYIYTQNQKIHFHSYMSKKKVMVFLKVMRLSLSRFFGAV